jgi:hypothetical protein
VRLRGRELRGALEHHRGGDVEEALHVLLHGGADDAAVEGAVDLAERQRELVEVRDAADDRGEVHDVRAALRGLARLLEHAQVALVDLAALGDPRRGGALVGDADLPVAVAQQAAHDRGADRAGATRHQDARHAAVRACTSAA